MTKVLIVDDNALMRKQVAALLQENLQYTVCGEGKDGVEAVEMFQQLQPDLVTLDMTMPRKGGIEALEEILKINPEAKVVIVSAITDASFITQAMQKGAKGYITKPLKLKDPEFVSRVKEDLTEVMAA